MVNWKALSRWNIPADRIPEGTEIMYRDPSVWTQYKWHIIAITSLCSLESALIVALLAQRVSRRRAEKAMRESQRVLQSAIDAFDARVALLNQEGAIIAVNEPWRSFAKANGYDALSTGAERNYLRVLDSGNAEESRVVSNGMEGLLSGELTNFRCVYSSGHDGETSWFQVRIKPFHIDGVLRLLVAHENVTEIKRAHDAQQQLTGLLLRAQDDERRRIARDLHDVTVQDLVVIRADLTRIQRPSDNHGENETLQESVSLCDRVIKELRTLSYLLHPPLLDEAGLIPALRWFVRGFIQRSGVQVELLVMEDIGRLAIDAEIALFRVVQECLTNVHRHSGSRSAVIWVTKEEGTVRVQITDEGHGFSAPPGADGQEAVLPTGVGIMGMSQRLKQLGGELHIESNSQGTTVNARIPVLEERDAEYSIGR
jgi:signal transduction histidine kinase